MAGPLIALADLKPSDVNPYDIKALATAKYTVFLMLCGTFNLPCAFTIDLAQLQRSAKLCIAASPVRYDASSKPKGT